MTSTRGSVQFDWRDDEPWLLLVGDVDYAATDFVSDAMLAEYETDTRFHADLAGVTFIDSTGLSLLLRLRHVAADGVVLHRVPESVARVIDLGGLTGLFAFEG